MNRDMIRKPVLAGSWYPLAAAALKADVEGYYAGAAQTHVAGEVVGLLAPHAGYVYSGQVAAHAYKTVWGESFDTVVILAPSHRKYFQGIAAFTGDAYQTPLGTVPVDAALGEQLIGRTHLIAELPAVHAAEHAVEIHLPLLQVALREFSLVPLIMGDQSLGTCEILAEVIVGALSGRRALFVASSDLSHYHPYEQAVRMDQAALKRVAAMDPYGLLHDLYEEHAEACGGGPVATVMLIARHLGADRAEILKYANSGDVTGDGSAVVGYAAAAFLR